MYKVIYPPLKGGTFISLLGKNIKAVEKNLTWKKRKGRVGKNIRSKGTLKTSNKIYEMWLVHVPHVAGVRGDLPAQRARDLPRHGVPGHKLVEVLN